jgi:hypothetical protein
MQALEAAAVPTSTEHNPEQQSNEVLLAPTAAFVFRLASGHQFGSPFRASAGARRNLVPGLFIDDVLERLAAPPAPELFNEKPGRVGQPILRVIRGMG